jgi:divalent metal cation (Fe/Co/Zn/Cd) transporter
LEVPVKAVPDITQNPPESAGRELHLHRAIRLSQASIAWGLASGVSAVVVGIITGGLSLAGYGLDALADAGASAIILHRFHTERREPHRAHALERRAARLVAIALAMISALLAGSAIRALATHHAPEVSGLGLGIAVTSMALLPPLAVAKRRTAARLFSAALRADSTLTGVAAVLALGGLLGLVLDPAFGWWWADSVIALLVVAILVREAWSIASDSGLATSSFSEGR